MESCEVASQERLKGRRETGRPAGRFERKENGRLKFQQPQEVKGWTSCLTVKVTWGVHNLLQQEVPLVFSEMLEDLPGFLLGGRGEDGGTRLPGRRVDSSWSTSRSIVRRHKQVTSLSPACFLSLRLSTSSFRKGDRPRINKKKAVILSSSSNSSLLPSLSRPLKPLSPSFLNLPLLKTKSSYLLISTI